MTYGVQIINDNGSLKLDDTLSRYRNVASGTTTTNIKTTHANQPYMPLVFLRPTAYGVPFRVGTHYTDGFWVYRPTANTVDSNFEYIVASRFAGGTIPTSGYGIRIVSASNVLLFSSFDPCVNIDYVAEFGIPSASQTFTLPAPVFGRRFVAMIGPTVTQMVASGNFLIPHDMLIRLDSETSITVYDQAGPAINTFMPATSLSVVGQTSLLISGYS